MKLPEEIIESAIKLDFDKSLEREVKAAWKTLRPMVQKLIGEYIQSPEFNKKMKREIKRKFFDIDEDFLWGVLNEKPTYKALVNKIAKALK